MKRLLGKQLHEYKLLAPLGQGGMAEVYLAKDLNLERAVAVKLVKEDRAGDERSQAALLREAQVAARIDHPNVGTVFRSGTWEGKPYYVMELLTGGSVAEVIEQKMAFTLHQYLSLLAQACAALEGSVQAGVVHRDVKPGNLMLNPSGALKLTDFGLARVADDAAARTSWMMGTPLYIAPEIVSGGGGDVGSDLYSLGATFFHLFVGRPPYISDGRPFGVVEQHRHSPVPDLREFSKRAPSGLRDLLAELMAKDPRDRPRSFRAVGERVRGLAESTRTAKLEWTMRWCTVDIAFTPANGDRCALCKNRYAVTATSRQLFDVELVGWRSPSSQDRVAEYMARAVGQETEAVRWQISRLPFRVGEKVTAEVAGRMEPIFAELGAEVRVAPAAITKGEEPPGSRTLTAAPRWPSEFDNHSSMGRSGVFGVF